jgi:hypothetical protein
VQRGLGYNNYILGGVESGSVSSNGLRALGPREGGRTGGEGVPTGGRTPSPRN